MIDIHSHILPGMDDGARDIFETLEMIEMAEKSGITAIVATPHCNATGGVEEFFQERYMETLRTVREAVKREGMSVELFPGAEAFGNPRLAQLVREGKIMTLNGSRYLLTEFDFHANPEAVNIVLEDLRDCGVIPVIAHPERYRFVQRDPQLVYEWRMQGFPIQVNKGSLRGKFGTSAMETAYLLMNHHLVSLVASDAHGPYQRTPDMSKAYEELSEGYPQKYVDMLFKENPRRICMNEPILALKAKSIE